MGNIPLQCRVGELPRRTISRFAAPLALLAATALPGCGAPRSDTHVRYSFVERIISPRHTVRLSELIGLSPTEAQQKLTGLSAVWPSPMALEVAEADGLHSFIDLLGFLDDEAARKIAVLGRGHSEFRPIGFSQCTAGYSDDAGGDPVGAILDTLEFRDRHLIGAWREPPEGEAHRPTVTLEDGPNFTSRWDRKALPLTTPFAVGCTRHDVVTTTIQSTTQPEDVAGDMQGMALLPFAVLLPGLNAKREAAMREGGVAFAELRPGTRLAGGAVAFATNHRFVLAHPSADPSYVLLEVDLGAYPSRNLTYFHQIGLAGVRNDLVMWRTPLGAMAGLARERELSAPQ